MADPALPTTGAYDNAAMLDRARRAYAQRNAVGSEKQRLRVAAEAMEGKLDHTPAMKQELAKLWLAQEEARSDFKGEILDWLIGIRDHTDNDVEYDLLSNLIDSVENDEHVRGELVIVSTGAAHPMTEDCPF